ncbi:hypothetical protein NDU88_001228 [Pleurodeles waltl]|uniref:Uncharacterized protein n=1 Tax=Pleurodeles waltl TaxID=8319 RepID=A0AAV7SAD4_PLEWA|nr:hypothetical protein NDU88_001228 [Pleurodeles waltl]
MANRLHLVRALGDGYRTLQSQSLADPTFPLCEEERWREAALRTYRVRDSCGNQMRAGRSGFGPKMASTADCTP